MVVKNHRSNCRQYAEYNWNKKTPIERFNLLVGGSLSDKFCAKLSKKSWDELPESEKKWVIQPFSFEYGNKVVRQFDFSVTDVNRENAEMMNCCQRCNKYHHGSGDYCNVCKSEKPNVTTVTEK